MFIPVPAWLAHSDVPHGRGGVPHGVEDGVDARRTGRLEHGPQEVGGLGGRDVAVLGLGVELGQTQPGVHAAGCRDDAQAANALQLHGLVRNLPTRNSINNTFDWTSHQNLYISIKTHNKLN